MSFLNPAFSGASNNFTQERPYAPGTQATVQDLQPQIGVANQNYGQANTNLNTLAQALQNQMQGQGPNLANAMLQQSTGQNVANQAALMAGQRGASQNVGLMSRQIANQGANIQQQQAGQASINRLQQQLAAQAQLGGVLGTQGSLANQNLGIQQGALQAQNANIAGVTNNYNAQGMNQAGENAKMNQGLIGGVANAGATLLGLADGGSVPAPHQAFANLGQGSNFGFNFVSGQKMAPAMPAYNAQMAQDVLGAQPQIIQDPMARMAQGGMVMPFSPVNMKQGGMVPGQPMQPGQNVPSNDTQPAMLTPQEIVLPLSVTQHPNAPEMAAEFVRKQLAMKGKK